MVTDRYRWLTIALVGVLCVSSEALHGWGERGHLLVNRLAVQALPDDGPVFLRSHEEWIAQTGPVPDTWRQPADPFLKIIEDPNHHWYKEALSFLKEIPRSRYEFVVAMYREFLKVGDSPNGERLLLPNVFAGTLPYEATEIYERLKAGMRVYRMQEARNPRTRYYPDTRFTENDLAFYMEWLGHYIGDGSQPLHVTIHGDGWKGPNPNGYATDRIHIRFETEYLELIGISADDVRPLVGPARVVSDPFDAVLAHLDRSAARVEELYRLEKAGAFKDASNTGAKNLVATQLAAAAQLLRDLVYTAWVESAKPLPSVTPSTDPLDRANSRFNPATGSAPAPSP